MRKFMLTLDTINILCLVYWCRNLNKLRIKYQSYAKSTKITAFEQKKKNATTQYYYVYARCEIAWR